MRRPPCGTLDRSPNRRPWSGSAGDAFRSAINGVDGDTDQLANQPRKRLAHWRFADSIDAVAQQMAHAREIAQAGGLTVSGTVILPPKPAGPPPMILCRARHRPSWRPDPSRCQFGRRKLHQQAVNTYNAQATVFNEAKAIVTSARNVERNAHDA